MIYAQILNGIVRNVIILNDETIAHLFAKNYDHCIRIDHLVPQPAIGWFYDGSTFSRVHSHTVEAGEVPQGVPTGAHATFESFVIRKDNYEFDVFLNGDLLHVGCHVYNYKWVRYALWMIKTHSLITMGPFNACPDGSIRYGNDFHISRDDVESVYNALCTLV
jgi:hypothetical protein